MWPRLQCCSRTVLSPQRIHVNQTQWSQRPHSRAATASMPWCEDWTTPLAYYMESHANEKTGHYGRRVLEVKNATFCPLIFTTNGGMDRECIVFYNRLAQELASKWGTLQCLTIAWMRTRLSFALCRSAHMCIIWMEREGACWSGPSGAVCKIDTHYVKTIALP